MSGSPSLGDARSQLGYSCDHQISPLKRYIFPFAGNVIAG